MLTDTKFDFAKIFNPLDLDRFFQEYWEEKPLHLSRGIADYYQQLFSVDDVDRVLNYSQIDYPTIRVVANQQELLPAKYTQADQRLNLNQLYKAYHEDHTIVINGLNKFWHPLAEFCSDLHHLLHHTAVANMYLSPPNSKGLHPHYDTHDVFVLQIEGSKNWEVHAPTQAAPLLNSFQPVIPEQQLGEAIHSVRLEAGDLLYIPRGYVHHAATSDSFSLHLTIGIYPTQWIDLISQALLAISQQDRRFRRALPVQYLSSAENYQTLKSGLQELTKTLAEQANIDQVMELLSDRFIRESSPVPDGHFSQINRVEEITLATRVIKRANLPCRLIDKVYSVSLQFPGNSINGPKSYELAMQYVANTSKAFTVSSLPDSLAEKKKINLIRRLVRGGLLKITNN
ncbi:MAG: cupin domain-containing protein [Cyanobacteria bacterium J06600_6]